MNKHLKILTFYTIVYSIILIILVVIIEVSFGYWFDRYNFGPDMRGKRIQKIIFKNNLDFIEDKENVVFYKDFYGFRSNKENIYEKYDASKIEVVFNGGSTSEEMFLNYDQTIVGNLNKFLHNDNIDITIYNAAVSGKSLVGNINEFSVWFEKIPNFKPKIMIYYIGLNDRYIRKKKRWHDYEGGLDFFQNLYAIMSQNSILWELSKRAKYLFFNEEVLMDQYFTFSEEQRKELAKNKIISYKKAKQLYKENNLEKTEKIIINNFKNNLYDLKKKLDEWNLKPIFITQITNDINGDKILFFLNNELKKFSEKNDYLIIKLDEIIETPLRRSFVDTAHTNKNGSEKIAKIIYPFISDFLSTNLLKK